MGGAPNGVLRALNFVKKHGPRRSWGEAAVLVHERGDRIFRPLTVLLIALFTLLPLSPRTQAFIASSGTSFPDARAGFVRTAMSFSLKSPAFGNGSQISPRYTCAGEDLSPALTWSGAPAAARTLAVIADDPDAPRGTFTHWLIWNLPTGHAELGEGVPTRDTFGNGARQGTNDFGRIGYRGPCPPHGRPHRYFFRLYALDTALSLEAGASRQELEQAMKGHVLAQAVWMGIFGR